MEEWKLYKLKQFTKNVSRRFDFKKHQNVVFVNTSDVLEGKFLHKNLKKSDELPGQAKKAIIKGDILFSEIRPKNKRYAFVDFDSENYVVSTKFMVIDSNDSVVDKKYFLQLLTSNERLDELQSIAEGRSGTFPQITFDAVANVEFNLPPVQEQKAIASILSALDDKIELNLQMNKTLEEMAMALYKHWFVDFGPFQNGKFIDSELGKIPEGWEVKSIYDLIDVIFGAPFKSKIFNEDKKGYPLIRIRDLKFGKPQYYTEENHIKKTVIRKGDILAGMDALFVPYSWSGEEGVMNQRVVFFKPKYNTVKRRFVYEAVKPWLKFYEGAKVGTTVIHLSKSDIDTFTIIYPNDHQILNSFNEQIEPLHEQIISNNIEIDHLTILRDTLLPKLISGEVRVKEFQQLVEASL